jgi:hypothetical protein
MILHDDVASDVHLFAYHNLRTAERIVMKFGMDVMPLEATPDSHFLISCSQ